MKQGLALGLLLALGLALCAGWMLGREEPGRAAGAQPLLQRALASKLRKARAQVREQQYQYRQQAPAFPIQHDKTYPFAKIPVL